MAFLQRKRMTLTPLYGIVDVGSNTFNLLPVSYTHLTLPTNREV